ncbi:MAG: glycosyltransferase N-terminal domain-containing protein, partial [Nitrospirota bacterium]
MFLLYSLLYSITALILLPFEYLKRPKEVRRRWLGEKFGFFDLAVSSQQSAVSSQLRTTNSELIWVHAVSMGEVISAVPFIKELASKHPSAGIILSTITDTGQKVARERLPGIAAVVYLPFDISLIFKKVLRRVRPDLFVAIETELWPNIFRTLERKGIPVVVVNGRISEGSFKGYNRIRCFMKDVLQGVDLFCMQDDIYAERIKMLGADGDRVKVAGNFKFDALPPMNVPAWTALLNGPVIVAGSTHRTEEDLIIDVYQRLLHDFPDLNLIIAPRHPERFKEVEELMRKRG